MAAPDRIVGVLGVMDRIVEVLRGNLNTAIAAVATESELSLPTLQTTDILIGDHPDVIPVKGTLVRVADADHSPGYTFSRGEGRGQTKVKVRVYNAVVTRVAVGGVLDGSHLPTLERVNAAMVAAVIATLEQGVRQAGTFNGVEITRARSLTRPPKTKVNKILVKCSELDVLVYVRHRTSGGFASP